MKKQDTTKNSIWIADITQTCSAGCSSFFGLGFLFRCGISLSFSYILENRVFKRCYFKTISTYIPFLPSTSFKVNKKLELHWLCVHPWTMLIVAESISPVSMNILQCSILLHVFLSFSLLQMHVRYRTFSFLLLTQENANQCTNF